VTYIKAYDDIRDLFSFQKKTISRGYQAKHFSFNVDGGRCETCRRRSINVEMVFIIDVQPPYETCNGKRFRSSLVTFHDKTSMISLQ
jgi:excinuclease ABC subunit A